MYTTLILLILGIVILSVRVAKWIINPYIAWKKNYQTRIQEYQPLINSDTLK
jgi:hypothetical protein